jgi:hypothetical protein
MKSIIGTAIGLLLWVTAANAQPYINSDVYDYDWFGKTLNPETCTTYRSTRELFKSGGAPLPYHSIVVQYAPSPCQYNGVLYEDKTIWTDVSLNDAWEWSYENNTLVSSNHVWWAPDVQPKRITEMAGYVNLAESNGASGSTNSRTCFGRTRFWINAVTNGNYHIRVQFTGGYWDNWFPGNYSVGDIDWGAPAVKQFSYVADAVVLNGGYQLDSNGRVEFYWNPYGGVTKDLTPSVGNVTRKRHWTYGLTMTIIP